MACTTFTATPQAPAGLPTWSVGIGPMFQLPASPRANRHLRMSVAVFICGVCALLGWHFIDAMLQAIDRLSGPMNSMPLRVAVQALLPGIPGLYLWSVATAFLLFAVIKFEPSWKQRRLEVMSGC